MIEIIGQLPKKAMESWIANSLEEEFDSMIQVFISLSLCYAAAQSAGNNSLPDEKVLESLLWLDGEIEKLNQLKLDSEKKKHLEAIRKKDS